MNRQRGFTLFEVLVALTLMALLTVVLFGGFRAGLRSWQALDSHVASVDGVRRLSDLLYRHLSQIMAVQLKDKDFRPVPAFSGESGRLQYVAPLSMSVGDVPHLVEISNAPTGRTGVWIRFAPVRPGQTAEQLLGGSTYQRVGEDVSVNFSYFVDGQWLDRAPPGAPPALVAVELRSRETSWPKMIISVSGIAKPEGL